MVGLSSIVKVLHISTHTKLSMSRNSEMEHGAEWCINEWQHAFVDHERHHAIMHVQTERIFINMNWKQQGFWPRFESETVQISERLSGFPDTTFVLKRFGYVNACTVQLFLILYNEKQMHCYFTNYHTPTCFDTTLSSSRRLTLWRRNYFC